MKRSRAESISFTEKNNPVVVGVNTTPILWSKDSPPSSAAFVRFSIMRIISGGFGTVPYYKSKKDKRDANAKRFSELESQSVLRMYQYEGTAMQTDRGPRVEKPFNIVRGNVLTFWIDDKTDSHVFDSATSVNIPAFSTCLLTLAPKSTKAKDSVVKIVGIKVAPFTLYSLFSDVIAFPSTLQDTRLAQNQHVVNFPMLSKDLDTKDVPFVVRLPIDTKFKVVDGDLQMFEWSADQRPVIIDAHIARAYTNTRDLRIAQSLLNAAVLCHAVYVVVFSNDFWPRSVYRGIPLLHTEQLLELVEPGAVIDTPYVCADRKVSKIDIESEETVDLGSGTKTIRLTVGDAAVPVEGTHDGTYTKDLAIVGSGFSMSSAFSFEIDLVSDKKISVFKGYINGEKFDSAFEGGRAFYSV